MDNCTSFKHSIEVCDYWQLEKRKQRAKAAEKSTKVMALNKKFEVGSRGRLRNYLMSSRRRFASKALDTEPKEPLPFPLEMLET
ncbi:MAG: hypothetical protein NWE93_11820 [Candidatus Bathyarchaeota archaeon]|nr:hypothetical protein [Candidatus Bathyarchaeota archaeon]